MRERITFPLCSFLRPHIFLPRPSLLQRNEIQEFVFERGAHVFFYLLEVDVEGGADLGRVLKPEKITGIRIEIALGLESRLG